MPPTLSGPNSARTTDALSDVSPELAAISSPGQHARSPRGIPSPGTELQPRQRELSSGQNPSPLGNGNAASRSNSVTASAHSRNDNKKNNKDIASSSVAVSIAPEAKAGSGNDAGGVAYHALPDEEALFDELNTEASGLSNEDAAERLKRLGPNRLTPPPKRSFLSRLWGQVNNVLIFILLAAAIVVGALQDYAEFGLILAVITANTAIGLIQEGKAEKAAEALKAMLSATALVLRDGQQTNIPAEDLVMGDVVLLKSGDKVPADLRLIECVNLQVQEAMLTGESVPVSKNLHPVASESSLGDRKCMAYSATHVTSGTASGVVVATGDNAEIGKINSMVNKVEKVETNLLLQLKVLGRWIAVLVLCIALISFLLALLLEKVGFEHAFETAVAIAVAIIPEGLPALVTIVLALGTTRMAKSNAIIRQLPCVETLGSLTVICSDKTGTLTKNEMTVVAIRTANSAFRATGVGYNPHDGNFYSATAAVASAGTDAVAAAAAAPPPAATGRSAPPLDPAEASVLNAVLEGAVLCNDSSLTTNEVDKSVQNDDEEGMDKKSNASRPSPAKPPAATTKKVETVYTPVGAPTEVALLTAGMKAGLDLEYVQASKPRVTAIPFESEHKFMATVHLLDEGMDNGGGGNVRGSNGNLSAMGDLATSSYGLGRASANSTAGSNNGGVNNADGFGTVAVVTEGVVLEGQPADRRLEQLRDGGRLDRQSGKLDRQSGKLDRQSGKLDRRSGKLDRQSRKLDRASAALAASGNSGGKLVMYVKGAPDRLLPMCRFQQGPPVEEAAESGKQPPLVPMVQDFWMREQEQLSSQGLRVLALCRADLPAGLNVSNITAEWLRKRPPFLTMVALIAILDPPREEAIVAVKEAHSAGIQVKMITGDHALTAAAIGDMLGIGGSVHLTGPEVDKMSDTELQTAVMGCNVFARSSPENKLRIVRALQAKRQVVAMTGDGVNDAPALKAADVGIAMGITGTDVSKEAAKMVLADDNFVSIVAAVKEGRRVWDNLRKILVFNLPVNFAQGTCIMWSYILQLDAVPLTAIQVLYVNLVTSITIGMMLAAEPAEPNIMSRPPRRPSKRLLGKLIIWRIVFVSTMIVVLVLGMFQWGKREGRSLEQRRGEAFNVLAFCQIGYSFACRFLKLPSFHPRVFSGNIFALLAALLTAGLQLFVTYTPEVNDFFGMTGLAGVQWARVLISALVIFLIVEVEKALVDPFLMPVFVRPVLNFMENYTPRWLQTNSMKDKIAEKKAKKEHIDNGVGAASVVAPRVVIQL